MTTTIIVETHSWPVEVTTHDDHSHVGDLVRSHGYQSTTTFVPKESKQSFHISDTRNIVIRELPQDATGLNQPVEAMNACDIAG